MPLLKTKTMIKTFRVTVLVGMVLVMPNVMADDLMTIYKKALLADPILKVSEFKVAMGEAQRGQAGGALLPQIHANINLSMNDRTTTGFENTGYKGERYNVSLTQSVIDFEKYWNWDRAKEVGRQYKAENKEAEQVLIVDVVERYFKAVEARDEYVLIQQEKQSTEKQLQQFKKQYKKQIIKITDVLEIEAKLNGLEADEIESEALYVIAKEGLRELTGENVETLSKLKTDIEFTPIEGDVEQWIEQAISTNPGLLAKQKSTAAALSGVAQQKSGHLPTVDIQLTYYFSNTGFEARQQPESETLVAGLNMSVPIFSGGATTRRADEANQKLEMVRQESIAKSRQIYMETKAHFLSTNASLRRIKAAQKALESSVKSRNAMEKGFKYGVQTIGDVLMSQAREFRSKKDLLQAKYLYIKSKMRFKRVVGTINKESLQELNAWLEPKKVF